MAQMRHRRNAINFDLPRHIDLILRKSQSRPKNISSFKHLHPVIVLNDSLDESQLTPTMTGVNLHFLLGRRVLLPNVEGRFTCFSSRRWLELGGRLVFFVVLHWVGGSAIKEY